MTNMKKRVAVVWGGAAWMIVCSTLLEKTSRKWEIILFEKNKSLWAKVVISWWWRCNLTTGYFKKKELKTAYTRGRDFLAFAMSQFWPKQVRKWFEMQWVACKQEDDGRIFPISNDGKEVVRMFTSLFDDSRLSLHYKEPVTSLTFDKKSALYTITTALETYTVDLVVLTTGGNAYAHTGSSWDGYAFARDLWHTITPLWPSLNSFMTKETWSHALSWLSFEDARISFDDEGEKKTANWPLLLTHFWISWPLTFIVASLSAFHEVSDVSPLQVFFSPLADLWREKWNQILLDAWKDSPKKWLITILSRRLPKRFCEALLGELWLESQQISILRKDDRKKIASRLWDGIPLSLIKRRPGDEFVTAWWVDTTHIHPKTGESTICPWLYFAGEILNVDGVTWWYNLQACWAMGRLVGRAILFKWSLS